MAIAFVAAGAVATGTTNASTPYPAGLSAGDVIIIAAAMKRGDVELPVVPPGFTPIPRAMQKGGHGTELTDTGTVWVAAFWRESDGTETGNVTVTAPVGSVPSTVARMFAYSKTDAFWDIWAANAPQNTAGTSWSAACLSDPGIAAGDVVLGVSGVNADTFTASAEAVASTGVTFGAAVERQDSGTNNGLDCALVVSEHSATAGTSSAPPTYSMTMSGATADAPAGASLLIRLREVGAAPAHVTHPIWSAGWAPSVFALAAVAVPIPAETAVGDLMLIFDSGHAAKANTPAGWNELATKSGGSGVEGVDTGLAYATVLWRINDGTEGPTVSVNGPTGQIARIHVLRKSAAAGEWQLAATTAAQNTASSSWSVTGAADPGLMAGDLLLVATAINSDTFAYSDQVAVVAGCTFDRMVEVMDFSTITGNDSDLIITEHPVLTGPSSAAPTYTMTGTGSTADSPAGATIWVRVRALMTADVAPNSVASSSSVEQPSVASTASVSPSIVASSSTVQAPSLIAAGVDITPATVGSGSAVGAPAIASTASVVPSTVASSSTVAQPSIVTGVAEVLDGIVTAPRVLDDIVTAPSVLDGIVET